MKDLRLHWRITRQPPKSFKWTKFPLFLSVRQLLKIVIAKWKRFSILNKGAAQQYMKQKEKIITLKSNGIDVQRDIIQVIDSCTFI